MQVTQVCPRFGIKGADLPDLFGCICCAVVVHVHGVPCADILVPLYIWKDLRVCLYSKVLAQVAQVCPRLDIKGEVLLSVAW